MEKITVLERENHLTVMEVAELLALSRSFIYSLINRGEIPAVKIGRSKRVRREDIDNFIRSRTINKTTPPPEYNDQ